MLHKFNDITDVSVFEAFRAELSEEKMVSNPVLVIFNSLVFPRVFIDN